MSPWLTLWCILELGFFPQDLTVMYAPPANVTEGVFYQELQAELRLFNNHIFAGGTIQIRDWACTNELGFWPERAGFSLHCGVRMKGLELGFEHYCTHSIVVQQPIYGENVLWDASFDRVYLRIEGMLDW
jgi:hypothetical protein